MLGTFYATCSRSLAWRTHFQKLIYLVNVGRVVEFGASTHLLTFAFEYSGAEASSGQWWTGASPTSSILGRFIITVERIFRLPTFRAHHRMLGVNYGPVWKQISFPNPESESFGVNQYECWILFDVIYPSKSASFDWLSSNRFASCGIGQSRQARIFPKFETLEIRWR